MYNYNYQELFHYGIPHRSGRYPYGSGDRPYQDREARRREKNLKVGSERLNNRIKRANELADVDRLSRKVGWKNTEQAAKAHAGVKNIKQISSEILEDEKRTEELGKYTRRVRALDVALTAVGSTTVASGTTFLTAILGAPAFASLALGSAPALALAAVGYSYYQKTKY